ncbi:MAG TPA: hypothetical protein VGD65_18380 [Chryseosolibacter sp.]
MSKKAKESKRLSEDQGKDEKKKNVQNNESSDQSPAEEKPFDFGGLPDRDLKKNLGCG